MQSQGGILLEHLKKLHLHVDAHPGDRLFWFTTTGWMMWNFLVSGLLTRAAIVLYDGNPGHPDMGVLWDLAERAGVTMFGTSASYIAACMKAGVEPGAGRDLSRLKAVGSTGSPLSPEGFDWIYEHDRRRHLALLDQRRHRPLHRLRRRLRPAAGLPRRAAGRARSAPRSRPGTKTGKPVIDAVGELVVTEPMPSMPVYFWGDPDGSRYRESYFEIFPGVWRHGDWIEITSRGTAVIYGRSDSTINRSGIRMGTSEIYRAVLSLDQIVDALVVDVPRPGTEGWMPLFIVLREGAELDDELRKEIARRVRAQCSPRHVPDEVFAIEAVPRTLSGKVLEVPVKRILMGTPADAGRQPRLARQPGGARLLHRDGGAAAELKRAPARPAPRRPQARQRREAPTRGDEDAAEHVARVVPVERHHRAADRDDQAGPDQRHRRAPLARRRRRQRRSRSRRPRSCGRWERSWRRSVRNREAPRSGDGQAEP